MAKFNTRFKSLKTEKAVNYQDLADLLGISVRAVQHYATGSRYPDFEGLIKLADFFNVSLDYLVGRSDERERR
ncbi:helix-turn-helix domain-containing protein [Shouchella lehensis]|uniref:XRE family transcriptional regulator n=1 Tax=Shouchella lehensis TaxID=300825 RepID=A0A4Y7WFP4_9BACI|nr:helix-turn-helix transcriptional regulator [Shouchella lehensis]MBG9785014.1 XRE family transcriptional regulator [Shouchella lehensis]TES46437.1 XRE family transcriptional regulator [Shouchella lehensis]